MSAVRTRYPAQEKLGFTATCWGSSDAPSSLGSLSHPFSHPCPTSAPFPPRDPCARISRYPAQAKLAFQVISERYNYRRSTAITTNRLFKDWTKVFPDALNAQVIAERLTERAETFILDGRSYRDPR
jgi:hypothetical protein